MGTYVFVQLPCNWDKLDPTTLLSCSCWLPLTYCCKLRNVCLPLPLTFPITSLNTSFCACVALPDFPCWQPCAKHAFIHSGLQLFATLLKWTCKSAALGILVKDCGLSTVYHMQHIRQHTVCEKEQNLTLSISDLSKTGPKYYRAIQNESALRLSLHHLYHLDTSSHTLDNNLLRQQIKIKGKSSCTCM